MPWPLQAFGQTAAAPERAASARITREYIVAVRCSERCTRKLVPVVSAKGSGAVVDCYGTVCFASLKGANYEYGGKVYNNDTQKTDDTGRRSS